MSTSEQAALVHGVSFPVCGLGCPCSTARGAQGGTLQGQGPAGFGCTVFGCSAFTPLPSPQKHPDFPKKPLTPYFRFFMEKRAKYAKLHPEMSNLDLTKILSKKYKELPEKKKVGLGDPAGSLCHVCLPGTPALPVQPAEPSSCLAQVSPGCWFRPVGPVRLPALLPWTAGWGWRFCLSVHPSLPDNAGWWLCRGVGRAGINEELSRCRLAVLVLEQSPRVSLSPAAEGRGAKSSVLLAHIRHLARAARGMGQEIGVGSWLSGWKPASGSSPGPGAL